MADYYREWANEYIVEEYEDLRRVVVSAVKNTNDPRVDDLMSDTVYEKLPQILKTWNADKGDLEHHVKTSLRWYVWKALRKSDRDKTVDGRFNSSGEVEATRFIHSIDVVTDAAAIKRHSSNPVDILIERETLSILKRSISPQQLCILRMKYVEELTITRMSELLCISKGTIYKRLDDALKAARECLEDQSSHHRHS